MKSQKWMDEAGWQVKKRVKAECTAKCDENGRKCYLKNGIGTVCLHMWKSLSRFENHSGIPIDRISLLSWCVNFSIIPFAHDIFKRKQSHKPFNFIKYNSENVRMIVTSVWHLLSRWLIHLPPSVEEGRPNEQKLISGTRQSKRKEKYWLFDTNSGFVDLPNERVNERKRMEINWKWRCWQRASEREEARWREKECQFTFHNGTIPKSVKVSEFIHNKFIITFDSLRCTTPSILIVFESYYNNRTEYPNFHQITTTTNDEHGESERTKKKIMKAKGSRDDGDEESPRVHVPWTPKHTHKRRRLQLHDAYISDAVDRMSGSVRAHTPHSSLSTVFVLSRLVKVRKLNCVGAKLFSIVQWIKHVFAARNRLR